MPASFETQFVRGRDRPRTALTREAGNGARYGRFANHQYRSLEEYEEDDASQRLSRLVLVRMNTLEAGFREVLNEVKDWRRNAGGNDGVQRKGSLSENDIFNHEWAGTSPGKGKGRATQSDAGLPGVENEPPLIDIPDGSGHHGA
jgi:hypothetical protein